MSDRFGAPPKPRSTGNGYAVLASIQAAVSTAGVLAAVALRRVTEFGQFGMTAVIWLSAGSALICAIVSTARREPRAGLALLSSGLAAGIALAAALL